MCPVGPFFFKKNKWVEVNFLALFLESESRFLYQGERGEKKKEEAERATRNAFGKKSLPPPPPPKKKE